VRRDELALRLLEEGHDARRKLPGVEAHGGIDTQSLHESRPGRIALVEPQVRDREPQVGRAELLLLPGAGEADDRAIEGSDRLLELALPREVDPRRELAGPNRRLRLHGRHRECEDEQA
jgi:hypothetical protein